MYKIETTFPLAGYLDSRIGGRSENQDCCGFSDTPLGALSVVCDGMGGIQGGAVASSIAVETIFSAFTSADASSDCVEIIRSAVLAANKAILDRGREDPELAGMGTTLTLVLMTREGAYLTYLGDSRIYQLHGKRKVFRTFDDSLVFKMVKSGAISEETARNADNSNIITKALGVSEDIEFEVVRRSYDKGDRFVLCTDGFWGVMPEPEILSLIGKKGDLETVFDRAMNRAEKTGAVVRNGQHDNLTALVYDVDIYSKYRTKMELLFKRLTILLSVLLLCCILWTIHLQRSGVNHRHPSILNEAGQCDTAGVEADSLNLPVVGDKLTEQHQLDSINENK